MLLVFKVNFNMLPAVKVTSLRNLHVTSPQERSHAMQVPKHVTEVDLRPLFEPYGEIMCLNVLRTQRGQGPSAGCAFVEVRCCGCHCIVRLT